MNKRIAFCINQIHEGGAERVIVNLANDFLNRGYEVYMITSLQYEDEYNLNDGIKRIVLNHRLLKTGKLIKNISFIREIRHICKANNIGCIVGFMRESNVRVILASLGIRTASIISVRGDPQRAYSGLGGMLIKNLILPLASGCVFQMDNASVFFPRRLRKKSMVIPNGVSEHFFDLARIPRKHLVVGMGRLNAVKNFQMLIKAVNEVRKFVPDIKLHIYGNGEEKKNLKSLIYELGLSECVYLMGSTKDVEQVYEEADIFVLTSNHEGMPNALIEAMASGVPCIAADCPVGAPRWLLKDGECGLLVEVSNYKELAQAIMRYCSDSDFMARMGMNGRERVREIGLRLIMNKWESYINDCIK